MHSLVMIPGSSIDLLDLNGGKHVSCMDLVVSSPKDPGAIAAPIQRLKQSGALLHIRPVGIRITRKWISEMQCRSRQSHPFPEEVYASENIYLQGLRMSDCRP